MARYRKKPVVIEAMRFPAIPSLTPLELSTGDFEGLGDEADDLVAFEEWLEPHARRAGLWRCRYQGGSLIIPTLEGSHEVLPGDFIIVGVAGEIYPCKPDIFAATYEPA